jgi:ATP-dependent Clp protease ATP-binding subunit ClpA
MSKLTRLEPNKLPDEAMNLLEFMSRRIVGQSRAINRIVNAYALALSPIRKNRKPAFAGLFIGPSGVGKTHTAEVLAEYFTDDPEGFTKVECANFFGDHSLSQLIGAPPGYLGYYEDPMLSQYKLEMPIFEKYKKQIQRHSPEFAKKLDEIQKLDKTIEEMAKRKDPQIGDAKNTRDYLIQEYQMACMTYLGNNRNWSVVLFDEVGEAHPQLHKFLLEGISKGRSTLANSKITKFYDTFMLMTSNYGAREIADAIRGTGEIGYAPPTQMKNPGYKAAMKALRTKVPPQFIGRLRRNIVVFDEFDKEKLQEVLQINIEELRRRLTETFPIEVTLSNEVKELLLENALEHPEYGARPLIEQIEADIEEPFAKIIGSGQVDKGDQILINVKDGEIVFDGDLVIPSFSTEPIGLVSEAEMFEHEDLGLELADPDDIPE